jgi:hypothetical protein
VEEEAVIDLRAQGLLSERVLAIGCFALGVLIAITVSIHKAPETAAIWTIVNLVVFLIAAFGWLLPVLSFGLLACSLYELLYSWRHWGDEAAGAIEAAAVGVGSLILMLVTGWAYLAFGLWRMMMCGDLPLWASRLTVVMLVGGCGLLFQQRWAALLVCGAGWWSLWRLWQARVIASVDPAAWKVALWLALLVLPMTAATIGFWRYLKGGWHRMQGSG